MLQDGGPVVWIQGILLLGGLLWSLGCAVLLALRWKVPPVIATAPLFAHAITAAAAASYGGNEAALALISADSSQRASLLAYAISSVLMSGVYAPAAVFSAGVLGVGAMVGGLRGPKWWGLPVVSILVFGFVALLPVVSVFFAAPIPLALGRVAMYGACAIPAGLAMAGAHPNQNGRESGVIAGVCFLTLVATSEIAVISLSWVQGFAALAAADPSSKMLLLAALQAELAPLRNLAWAAMVISTLPAVLALFRAPMPLTDEEIMTSSVNPSGMRWFGSLLALLLLPLWAIVFASVDPSGIMEDLGKVYKVETPASR